MELSNSEILQKAIADGIIDINTLGKQIEMNERKKYMSDLGVDMAEMIKDMTPEERTLAKTKLTTLVQKM